MKTLRVFSVLLLCLLFLLGGCAGEITSSEAPVVSSETASVEASQQFESVGSVVSPQTSSVESQTTQSSQTAKTSTPSSQNQTSSEQQPSSTPSSADKITYELREKYFDLLSRSYSEIVPYMDFGSPDDFSLNDLVMYATMVTEPSKKGDPETRSTSIFPRALLEESVKKYLGVELGTLSASSPVYIYHPADDVVYMNSRLPSRVCYYRLNAITESDNGVVTAEFSVYKEDFPGVDEYASRLEAIKADICGSASPNVDEYEFFKVLTLSFTEHTDSDGTYLTFLSEISLDREPT